ncbi:MAG: branched-chain amino acid ABC transporter permease, partial [Bradyrhizobiaceae bacterium]|nr:branched-chain amino acid ABC transporter permease [Bradyrhizobiaceae bacterium]
MTPEIALILAQDGITTGAVYVLLALGIVLVFLVTRVIFVPFGDVVGYSALTLAALQLGKLPGTVWLVATLAAIATLMACVQLIRRGEFRRLPRALLLFAGLPLASILPVVLLAGHVLPAWLAIGLTILLVLPIAPLLYRIAFLPLADASV